MELLNVVCFLSRLRETTNRAFSEYFQQKHDKPTMVSYGQLSSGGRSDMINKHSFSSWMCVCSFWSFKLKIKKIYLTQIVHEEDLLYVGSFTGTIRMCIQFCIYMRCAFWRLVIVTVLDFLFLKCVGIWAALCVYTPPKRNSTWLMYICRIYCIIFTFYLFLLVVYKCMSNSKTCSYQAPVM